MRYKCMMNSLPETAPLFVNVEDEFWRVVTLVVQVGTCWSSRVAAVVNIRTIKLSNEYFNPLKGSGIGWLHFKVYSAIQV